MSKELYQKMARKTAEEFGLPVPMFMALVDHESGWKLDAKSQAGALGLGQVMPDNLKKQGVNIDAYMKDPALQLNRSAYMYQDAIRQAKGDPILGLAFYNASPKAVNAFLAGKKQLPVETANYVPTVLMGAQKFGGTPLPSQAMADVKARFGSRMSDKTLQAKAGTTFSPSTQYAQNDGAGLDAPSMADTQIAQADAPQQVAPQAAAQQQQFAQVDMAQPSMDAQAPMVLPGFEAPSLQASMNPDNFDVEKVLGLSAKQAGHGYPDWFGKMIENEVAAA
jgi:Transglycosylase SLT domain